MIDLVKMEKDLLAEYPDDTEDILNGIKALKGWKWDEDEAQWVGEDRSEEEIGRFIQEVDDSLGGRRDLIFPLMYRILNHEVKLCPTQKKKNCP